MITDQKLVDEDDKLGPSPAVSAINRALQQSKTGQGSINWEMVVRSLLGLYPSVIESVTYVDKKNGTDFFAAL